MDRSWSQTERFSSLQPTTGGFITLSSRGKGRKYCAGLWNWLECVRVCVYLRCQGSKQSTVSNRRGLLVADTKPLLCNQLSVKSPLCGPHKAPQRQGAGGWGQSAATQLWAAYTSQLNMGPPYICCNLAPASAGSRDNGGPRQTLLLQMFSESLFCPNLKYFIRPPSLHSLSFTPILKSIAGTSSLNPLRYGDALKKTKDSFQLSEHNRCLELNRKQPVTKKSGQIWMLQFYQVCSRTQ